MSYIKINYNIIYYILMKQIKISLNKIYYIEKEENLDKVRI